MSAYMMDGWMDGWMMRGRWMGEWMVDGCMNGTDICMGGGCVYGLCMDVRMNEWLIDLCIVDGCMVNNSIAEVGGQVVRHVVDDAISLRIFPQHNGEMMGNWPDFTTCPPKKQHKQIVFAKNSFAQTTGTGSPHGVQIRPFLVI